MLSRARQDDGPRHSQRKSLLGAALLLFVSVTSVEGWGSSSNGDLSLYSNSYERDWLEDGSTISMKIHGCVESYVDDGENAACMEEDSDDGTTYWYMMSNCKRANVVYSLYDANNCNSGNFKESVRPFRSTQAFSLGKEYLSHVLFSKHYSLCLLLGCQSSFIFCRLMTLTIHGTITMMMAAAGMIGTLITSHYAKRATTDT